MLQLRRRRPGRSRLSTFICWTLCPWPVIVYFRVIHRWRHEGAANVPATGPLVFVANHQSHLDPPLVGALCVDRPLAFMARESLFRFRPFGWLIRTFGAIPLDRGRGDSRAMRAALDELHAGRCVLIFPEGTRSRDGTIGRFQRGFLLLARRTGATVVPVAVEGAFDAWPRSRTLPRAFSRIAVKAGTPIRASALGAMHPDAAVGCVRAEIDRLRLELRAVLRRDSGGRCPAPGPGDHPSPDLAASGRADSDRRSAADAADNRAEIDQGRADASPAADDAARR